MVSRTVRACSTRFNEASRPFLVTNGKQWWVEDHPNNARMLPASSEQEALENWDKAVAAARPKLHPVDPTPVEVRRASDRH